MEERSEGGWCRAGSVVGSTVMCRTLTNQSTYAFSLCAISLSPYITHALLGLILVHDLTNRKSHSHLSKWLAEYYQSSRASVSSSTSITSKRHSTYADSFQ